MDDSDDIRRQLHCSVVKGDTLLQNDVLASEVIEKVHACPEVTEHGFTKPLPARF